MDMIIGRTWRLGHIVIAWRCPRACLWDVQGTVLLALCVTLKMDTLTTAETVDAHKSADTVLMVHWCACHADAAATAMFARKLAV